ncbi:MAG: hypothetical protein M3R21_03340 [Candidatus Dormibacteraeota bacterium]|nr:hypothetical protein [Candidatus Dormibacteraeota bacterium]
MEDDHGYAKCSDGRCWQPDERGEQDHAPAEHPDDAGQEVVAEIEIEGPRHPNHGELEQHQYQTASDEVPRQRAAIAQAQAEKVRRRAGEKGECRRDEVGDPAREEDTRSRPTRRHPGVHTHVIDGHEDHCDAPRDVDRVDPPVGLHAQMMVRLRLCGNDGAAYAATALSSRES